MNVVMNLTKTGTLEELPIAPDPRALAQGTLDRTDFEITVNGKRAFALLDCKQMEWHVDGYMRLLKFLTGFELVERLYLDTMAYGTSVVQRTPDGGIEIADVTKLEFVPNTDIVPLALTVLRKILEANRNVSMGIEFSDDEITLIEFLLGLDDEDDEEEDDPSTYPRGEPE